ncbi:MAG: LIM domain-containing protein [Candidatus Sericytochromatia bacterium]|nr:LIM domain-containing protein [Candidatus Sericytochromatia bacterium]
MVCADCREPITGRYLKVGRLTFHPEHFRCRACGQVIVGGFQTHQGAFLHPACFAERHAPRCGVCEKPITDRYVQHEGRAVHATCYGKHFAARCDVCRRAIVGTWLKDHWGHVYHAEHQREFATCLYCGRLCHDAIGGGGVRYADGRAICRLCHRTAVHRDGDVARTVAAIRRRMAAWGVDLGAIEAPVQTVDRHRLGQLLGRSHAGIKAVSGIAVMNWERHGREVRNKRATICLLHGLPLQWLEGTAAHELMHVWNFHHGPPHAFELEEGSCNYLSYRVHQEQGGEMAAYHIESLMKDPHPAYGVGFRRVKRFVERRGFDQLLLLLQRARDFPMFE